MVLGFHSSSAVLSHRSVILPLLRYNQSFQRTTVEKCQCLKTDSENVDEAQPIKEYALQAGATKGLYRVESGEEIEVAAAGAQALIRLGSAAFVSENLFKFRKRPEKTLELYEFEGCPFCRKVREAISILDLDVLIYPCPKDGPRFRPKAKELSGKSQFPFLVDPNTDTQLLESDDIISYLWDQYGDGKENIPLQLKPSPLTNLSVSLALLPRFGRGSQYTKSVPVENPLILWGYEASPFCKLVREVLTEQEIPHLYKTVARNSPKRAELLVKWDVFQVPYLEDPNSGKALFETKSIIEYLRENYGNKA